MFKDKKMLVKLLNTHGCWTPLTKMLEKYNIATTCASDQVLAKEMSPNNESEKREIRNIPMESQSQGT